MSGSANPAPKPSLDFAELTVRAEYGQGGVQKPPFSLHDFQATIWVLTGVATLAALMRYSIRYALLRSVSVDDITYALATALVIARPLVCKQT